MHHPKFGQHFGEVRMMRSDLHKVSKELLRHNNEKRVPGALQVVVVAPRSDGKLDN